MMRIHTSRKLNFFAYSTVDLKPINVRVNIHICYGKIRDGLIAGVCYVLFTLSIYTYIHIYTYICIKYREKEAIGSG